MAAQTKAPAIIEGYTLLQTKRTAKGKPSCILHVKQHASSETDASKPSGRTLYVSNISPYLTKENLEAGFGIFGPIKDVKIEKHPTGMSVAYIVFKNAKSIQSAKKHPYDQFLILNHPRIKFGSTRFMEKHKRVPVDMDALATQINKTMEAYDKKKEMELQQEKEGGEPDEDGWVVVTTHGRNPGTSLTEDNQRKAKAHALKKSNEKQLINFYHHQVRESKEKHIKKLQEQFEEDKNRAARMRAQRKFKPY